MATDFPAAKAEPGFIGFPSADGVANPIYALGIGSTFSINAGSKVADGAAAVFDTIFSQKFYSDMNSVWQGEWNLPLKDLSQVKIASGVTPLYAEVMKNLSAAVANNQYGYTTWTFLPPATDTYMVSGMEEVWLNKTSTKDYLKKWDDTFKQEKSQGKVPAIPKRAG